MGEDRRSQERRPFDRDEYRRRVERTRERMTGRGLDALLITDPANMNYLTGYDAWSFYVHQGVVLPASGDPVWVGREMDAGAARATTWLPEERVRSYGDEYVQSSEDRHPMDVMAEVLSDLGAARGRLGVEMDAYYYTARSHRRLGERLPEAELTDATLLVNRVRLVKSEAELACMRRAGRLADEGMRRGIAAVEAGVRESEAAAEIYRGLIGGGDLGYGGEYPAIAPLMPAGRHTDTPHLTPSDRRFEEGDPVIVELAGTRHRYHAPLARTLSVGEPPDGMREVAGAVVEGLAEALDAVRPGVTAAAVERAWRESVARHGLEKESRLGYACGLGYPPDWGEHTVSLRPGDQTELEPNMTFHVIPGVWLDGWGVEISETVVVTESGVETLSEMDRELVIR